MPFDFDVFRSIEATPVSIVAPIELFVSSESHGWRELVKLTFFLPLIRIDKPAIDRIDTR